MGPDGSLHEALLERGCAKSDLTADRIRLDFMRLLHGAIPRGRRALDGCRSWMAFHDLFEHPLGAVVSGAGRYSICAKKVAAISHLAALAAARRRLDSTSSPMDAVPVTKAQLRRTRTEAELHGPCAAQHHRPLGVSASRDISRQDRRSGVIPMPSSMDILTSSRARRNPDRSEIGAVALARNSFRCAFPVVFVLLHDGRIRREQTVVTMSQPRDRLHAGALAVVRAGPALGAKRTKH